MTRLVLHVGDYKTGTSAVQRAVVNCASPLAETPKGALLYPVSGRGDQKVHHSLAWELLDSPMYAPRQGGWAELGEEIREVRPDIALVSTESLESVPPGAIAAALERRLADSFDGLQVVAYVRPHAERILSAYSQKVKTGQVAEALPAFVRRAIADDQFRYAPRLAAWRDAFGDAFTARPYIRDRLTDRDIVADFLHLTLDMTPADIGADTIIAVNDSPSLEAVLAMRKLVAALGCAKNRQEALWHEHNVLRPIRAGLEEHYANSGKRLQFPAKLADRVAEAYRNDAEQVDNVCWAGEPIFASALVDTARKAQASPAPMKLEVAAPLDAELHRLYASAITKIVRTLRN